MNKYNWKDIDFLTDPKDWKKFEQNNERIALTILYAPYKTKQMIKIACKSKYNRKRKNQVVLLMITDDKRSEGVKKYHYLTLKNKPTIDGYNRPIRGLSRLRRGISSNHVGDYYCLNCFHSKSTDNALKKHERLCGNYDYWHIVKPKKDNKILKYNHREKSLKAPAAIYADLECFLKKEQIMKIMKIQMKIMKMNFNTEKSEIFVITLENLEEQLIVFAT